MVDLGLYNFIQNEIAKGRQKDDIVAQLVQGGNKPEVVEEAYAAVLSGASPVPAPVLTHATVAVTKTGERPPIITAACAALSILLALNLAQVALLVIALTAASATGARLSFASLDILGVLGLVTITMQLLAFVIIYGYWMMRRWAVYLYCALQLIGFLISLPSLATNPLGVLSVAHLFGVFVIWAGVSNLDTMT